MEFLFVGQVLENIIPRQGFPAQQKRLLGVLSPGWAGEKGESGIVHKLPPSLRPTLGLTGLIRQLKYGLHTPGLRERHTQAS